MILAINGMESATMAAGWALEELGVSPVRLFGDRCVSGRLFGDRCVSGRLFGDCVSPVGYLEIGVSPVGYLEIVCLR